jgi:hypothetical protein
MVTEHGRKFNTTFFFLENECLEKMTENIVKEGFRL